MAVVNGKVALITGGCGGIGFAMVTELLQNGLKGVSVVDVVGEESAEKTLAPLRLQYGSDSILFIQADITESAQFEAAFQTTIDKYQQLDIVINNAGIGDEVQWEKTLNVNLRAVISGSYLAIQKYLPKYRSGPEGILVNVASVLGVESWPTFPVYSASKHGVVSLGRSFGSDVYYRRHQVRVLTICPGTVSTPLFLAELQGRVHCTKEEVVADIKQLNSNVQLPEFVGKALIQVLEEGENGSIWVTEDSKPPYEVVIPDRRQMQKK